MGKQSTRSALKKVMGQPSWRIANDQVEAFVTQTGGHVAPVKFKLGRKTVEPFSVAPWASEKIDPKLPNIIKALRGDFFCMPFGGNSTPFGRERYPVHGETANAKWTLESLDRAGPRTCLHLSLATKIRRGRVDKRICLLKGHSAIYSQNVVSKMSGPMDFGHHAMVKFPDDPASGVISTSPFVYGQVFPGEFENPEQGGYASLRSGAQFGTLWNVPMFNGQTTDLSHYPARRGFEDLVMICSSIEQPIAWTAVTFPKQRYVWFALKDPRVLRNTVMWFSNAGRHYAPWSGRHVNVVGLEEVTAYFHYGIAESAGDNPVARRGIETCVQLDPDTPLVVNYIMAVAAVPEGFDRVARIEADEDAQTVALITEGGQSVSVPLDVSFLHGDASQM